MALRSKPIQLVPTVLRRTGETSYRVTGTIRGKRRFFQSTDLEEAQAKADEWETERVGSAAALRTRVTRLSQAQLTQAEAAIAMCEASGRDLMELLLWALKSAPEVRAKKLYADAAKEFLQEKEKTSSLAQQENLRLAVTRFGESLAPNATLSDVTHDTVTAWLKSRKVGKRTWNSYRNDLNVFCAWCTAKPRQWLAENPVETVLRYGKRQLKSEVPERLPAATVRELMLYLENEKPEWVTYFAVTFWAGVRPDRADGEMAKLAAKVRTDGVHACYRDGFIYLSADITKDGRPRKTVVPPNLAAWLDAYPMTPDSLAPRSWGDYGKIRKRFAIPHDGMRHTCFSAYVGAGGSIGSATLEFGNSVSVALDHYLSPMSPSEAAEYYSIRPTRGQQSPSVADWKAPPPPQRRVQAHSEIHPAFRFEPDRGTQAASF